MNNTHLVIKIIDDEEKTKWVRGWWMITKYDHFLKNDFFLDEYQTLIKDKYFILLQITCRIWIKYIQVLIKWKFKKVIC